MQATPVRWMPLAPGLTYRSVRAPAVSSHGFLNRVTLQANAVGLGLLGAGPVGSREPYIIGALPTPRESCVAKLGSPWAWSSVAGPQTGVMGMAQGHAVRWHFFVVFSLGLWRALRRKIGGSLGGGLH